MEANQPAATPFGVKKVVIVDDSATLRGWLRVVLEQDPRLAVVGEADCANAARQVIKDTNPDVVTLDIEMPGMNGLEFLEKIMRLRPLPVVMISAATEAHSEASITALSLGAVDCILKPTDSVDERAMRAIARRVFSAACSSVQLIQPVVRRPAAATSSLRKGPMPLIAVGASTGGVAALEVFLAGLAADCPPVVIVQHMPGTFLVSFSRQLNTKLPQDVAIARENETLGPGQIRLAPALNQHTEVKKAGDGWRCQFSPGAGDELHCPSVDALFRSVVPAAPDVIGVILTGLGRDGADPMVDLRKAGARTFGQDEASSVVYGMPRAAYELGAVGEQLSLTKLGPAVMQAVEQYQLTKGGQRSS